MQKIFAYDPKHRKRHKGIIWMTLNEYALHSKGKN
jgi:hypothetical protein